MLAAKVVEVSHNVDMRLAELGLEQSVLIEALNLANLYRVRTTDHHPRLYRYQIMYGETVAALRDLLAPRGWRKLDDGNYELTINASGSIAIAVASGDDCTGVGTSTPSNRSPKGRHTIDAVELNRQADLFAELLPAVLPRTRKTDTWVLLHHISKNKIQAELSRPNEIDSDGKIVAWSERILLGVIPLDSEEITIDQPQLPDIDIKISRKSL
jgi:hypothetical protein